jgi:CRP/FNR family transcriptional regulator
MMSVMLEGPVPLRHTDLTFEEAAGRVPFLRALSPKQRELLKAIGEIRWMSPGDPVFALGEPSREFVFLVRGHVKLVRARGDGREVILDIRGPGDLLCAGAVTAFAPYCCSAIALDGEVTAIAFPRRDVNRLLEDHAPISALFVQEATGHEMRMAERVFELSSGYVEQRISALLSRLADQVGVAGTDGTLRIPVKLSRQDLADLCGTTLESAIRTMTHLARENVVKTTPRGFLVTNRSQLERLASRPG